MYYICFINATEQRYKKQENMKKQLELSQKLIFRLQSILEGEDEQHKIERLIFKIEKIKEFSKKSKQELKKIILSSEDDLEFIISLSLFSELSMRKMDELGEEMIGSFESHKHLISIK